MINLINVIAKWDYYIIYMNRKYCYHWFSNPLLQMFYILFNKFKLISTVFQHNDLHLKHIHVLVFLSNTYPKQKIKLFSFYSVCNNWYTNACNKIIVTIFIYVQIFVINGCKHNIACNLEIFMWIEIKQNHCYLKWNHRNHRHRMLPLIYLVIIITTTFITQWTINTANTTTNHQSYH